MPGASSAIAAYEAWRAEEATASRPTGVKDEPWDTIDACVLDEMQALGTTGASIAVLRQGELAYTMGYGLKRADGDEPPDAETLFRIGSTTKMMTAAALLQQVEAGKVDLDAPVTDLLPNVAIAGAWDESNIDASDITGRHLLTHTGAFLDNLIAAATLEAMQGPTGPLALATWTDSLADHTLHAPPGEFWNYSNPNFSLAGRMVEVATGRLFSDVIVDDVWRPAGMTLSTMVPADAIAHGNYSHGHGIVSAMTGAVVPPVAPDGYEHLPLGPAGMAFSTPTEMVRWAKLLMSGGGDVLSRESVDAMQGEQVGLGVIPGQWYGFGVFVEDVRGIRVYEHGGNVPGWSSQLYWIPEQEFAVSILANGFDSLSRSAGCTIVNVIEDLEPPTNRDWSTAPATWDRYAGDYRGLVRNGVELAARVDRVTDTLRIVLIDGLGPGRNYTTTLQQAALDTFLIDLNSDGQPDTDLSFIDHPQREGEIRWLRNRAFVLARRSAPAPTPSATTPPPAPTSTIAAPAASATPALVIQPEACPQVEARVPAPALASALANPRAVRGYGDRCFPSQPASPFNPLRDRLSLQNPNRPYHPIYNVLIFACGCR